MAVKAKTNTARKPVAHRSTVSNPGGRKYHVGGGGRGKQTTRRSGGASSTRRHRRNPTTAVAKTNPSRRRNYRRNPSPTTNAAFFAIGGVLAVRGFDLLINKLMPQIAVPIRIGAATIAGWAVGRWGTKYLGSWAGIAQTALWFKAALDAYDNYVAPMVAPYLGITSGTAVVAQQQVQNKQTGQMGMRLHLNDGNMVDVFENQDAAAYA